MGLVVDHELELTEIRVRQLDDVVDVFVILESNVTAGQVFQYPSISQLYLQRDADPGIDMIAQTSS